ncbi:MAG: hypothetical protein DA330_04855 [Nitrososphaera sp.]|nr:hypothetical protein [Nitrososphaera sp.]
MTLKNCKAEIKVNLRKQSTAESIHSAILPDLKNLQASDEVLRLSLQGSVISLELQTPDLASLRANTNSFLRLVDAAYRCIV